ncbi:MAG: lysophospholipid acyltransferase family protein [Spirochaetota bacterium]
MGVRFRVVTLTIRLLLKLLVRVRAIGIDRIPRRGPLIIAINHINFLEVPLLFILLRPRRLIGLAKVETWDNPVLRVLANLWDAIPIRRESVDTAAFRRAEAELKRGSIVAIAPEGLRTYDGSLQRGHAGVAMLAARTGAPVLPIAHHGGEAFWRCLKRARRTKVTVRVGSPIRIPPSIGRVEREHYVREIMTAIARMLPERYRGYYATQ